MNENVFAEFERLKTECARVTGMYYDAKQEANALRDQLAAAVKSAEELRADRDKFLQLYRVASEDAAALMIERDAARADVERLTRERDALDLRVRACASSREAIIEAFDAARAELTTERERSERMREALEGLKGDLEVQGFASWEEVWSTIEGWRGRIAEAIATPPDEAPAEEEGGSARILDEDPSFEGSDAQRVAIERVMADYDCPCDPANGPCGAHGRGGEQPR